MRISAGRGLDDVSGLSPAPNTRTGIDRRCALSRNVNDYLSIIELVAKDGQDRSCERLLVGWESSRMTYSPQLVMQTAAPDVACRYTTVRRPITSP